MRRVNDLHESELGISTSNRHRIAHLCMKTFGKWISPTSQNSFEVSLHFPKVELIRGNIMSLFLDDESGQILDWITDAFQGVIKE